MRHRCTLLPVAFALVLAGCNGAEEVPGSPPVATIELLTPAEHPYNR